MKADHFSNLDKPLRVSRTRFEKRKESIRTSFVSSGSLWSVMTFGMGSSASTSTTNISTEASNNSSESTIDLTEKHLANQSIHLLLILSNHFTNDVHRNPYRLALLHFTDTQGEEKSRKKNIDF